MKKQKHYDVESVFGKSRIASLFSPINEMKNRIFNKIFGENEVPNNVKNINKNDFDNDSDVITIKTIKPTEWYDEKKVLHEGYLTTMLTVPKSDFIMVKKYREVHLHDKWNVIRDIPPEVIFQNIYYLHEVINNYCRLTSTFLFKI